MSSPIVPGTVIPTLSVNSSNILKATAYNGYNVSIPVFDASGNLVVPGTLTSGPITTSGNLNLTNTSATGGVILQSLYAPNLGAGGDAQIRLGLAAGVNTDSAIVFTNVGPGSASNWIGMGVDGGSAQTLWARGDSSAHTLNNVLDDANGNISLNINGSSTCILSSNGTANNTLFNFFQPNLAIGGSANNILVGQGSANNQCVQIRFTHNAFGSSTNTAQFGLQGASRLSIDGGGNIIAPANLNIAGTLTTSGNLTLSNNTVVNSAGGSFTLPSGSGTGVLALTSQIPGVLGSAYYTFGPPNMTLPLSSFALLSAVGSPGIIITTASNGETNAMLQFPINTSWYITYFANCTSSTTGVTTVLTNGAAGTIKQDSIVTTGTGFVYLVITGTAAGFTAQPASGGGSISGIIQCVRVL
jgi:hypothetical protein